MAKQKLEGEVALEVGISDEQVERIRQRAFELYVARGQEDGHDFEDWLQAEAEVRAESESATK